MEQVETAGRHAPFLLRTKDGTRLIVQDRDVQVLEYIAKHRLVTEERLRCRFWGDDRGRNHFTRLRQFRKAGLIDLVTGDGGSRLGYRIDREGLKILQAVTNRVAEVAGRLGNYRTSYEHDQLLQRIRDLLEASPLVSEFTDEATLRRQRGGDQGGSGRRGSVKVPDGLFMLTTTRGKRSIALELEIARKSWPRYREVVRRLATDSEVDSTFFVVAGSEVEGVLKKAILDARSHDPAVRSTDKYRGFYFVGKRQMPGLAPRPRLVIS